MLNFLSIPKFIFCRYTRFGTVPVLNTYIRRLFERNSPGMEEDTQRKYKMEALNHVCISRADTDLASSGVGDDNNKLKILKYLLAKLPISNMEIFQFKIVNINETETRDKDETISYI